ncbi:uncharacterized protein LOC141629646 [Silene latifolia]|uniref:uncharacterized protein LOC141629646 n=1 Tax=Silene latifolia TaxID=37657 RepID=UPI003D789504
MHRKYSRLDRFLINAYWTTMFPEIVGHFYPEGVLDHTPCVVYNNKLTIQKNRSFKYFSMWSGAAEFLPKVQEVWDRNILGTKMFCIVKKLKELKTVLKELNKTCYADIEVQTVETEKELNTLQLHLSGNPTSSDLISQEIGIIAKLRRLLKDRDSFLQQKAKAQWLEEGDTNSAYFHGIIRKKCMRNTVIQIEDQHGIVCSDSSSIQSAFLEYYQGLLGSKKTTEGVRDAVLAYGNVCSEEHVDILSKPVTFEEVKQVVFSIPIDKAPGPDGFSSGFFRDAWSVIGQDVFEAIKEFFVTGQLLGQINATNVCLIPKSRWTFHYHPLCKGLKLTHLMFADDLLMFSKGDAPSILLLLRAFSSFSKASGLSMNNKEVVNLFNGMQEDLQKDILAVSGFQEGTMPFKYLGVPIQPGKMSKKDCNCLIEKMVAKICSLGAKKLSYAGRVVLINSVLNTLYNYWAAMFIITKSVIKRVEAICRNFLRSSSSDYHRVPLVGWDRVTLPKDEGGLGIKKAELWNTASVGKLVNWLYIKPDRLWIKWVANVYLKGVEWDDYTPGSDTPWTWKSICKVKERIKSGFHGNLWISSTKGYSIRNGYEWLMGQHPKTALV